jgi:membrane-associated protein
VILEVNVELVSDLFMYVKLLISFVLHIDVYLGEIIRAYGTWTYLILFLIIFCETGLVVTPFLPGDSLLFAAGFFAAQGDLKPMMLFVLLSIAAVCGDSLNYWIGKLAGPKVFQRDRTRFFKKEHLIRTHRFFETYGGKTIIIARFIPIVRTFAPFVAGIGAMSYPRFITYNIVGGIVWIAAFVLAGFYFGNIPMVKNNFSIVGITIIAISVLPAFVEVIRRRWSAGRQRAIIGGQQIPESLEQ